MRGRARRVVAFAVALATAQASLARADETAGDLSHLTFTASGPLTASLVSPAPGDASDFPAALVEVATEAGGGVELDVNDAVVPATKIGKRTVDARTGETHYFFYGVPLIEGPNRVRLTPLGSGDARGAATEYTIFGPGKPVALHAAIVGALRSDGRTSAVVRIDATDAWSHHAQPGAIVRLTILSGDAHFRAPQAVPDARATTEPSAPPTDANRGRAIGDPDAARTSIDVPLENGGTAGVALVAGLQPGDVRVRASFDALVAEDRTFVEPALRKPLVVGLATAGVGSVPAVPGEAATVTDGANARAGRIALYATGEIAKSAQATVAYDTADRLQQTSTYGIFNDNPQERPYATFGDASARRDDALSRDHLFARVDAGRSSAMWGEFEAQTGGNDGLGGFNLLVAGAKVEVAGRNARASLFNARNDVAYARRLFDPTGLSTIGTLLHPEIVVGSELITLVALDRRTGAVIAQTSLTRNVDYTLDYASGQLRFINPPLPYDESFDPQQLLVQYEYAGAGVDAQTTGGRFDVGFGAAQRVRAGIGYVNDAMGTGSFSLLGEDVGGRLPGGAWSIGHQATRGAVGGDVQMLSTLGTGVPHGDAYRADFAETLGANRYQFGFESTSAQFENPFGGLATPGLLDYRAAYSRALPGKAGDVTLAFDRQQNFTPTVANAQADAAIRARVRVGKRLALHAGFDDRMQTAGIATSANAAVATPAPASGVASGIASATVPAATDSGSSVLQADFGAEYRVTRTLSLAADRIATLGGGRNAAQPAQTTLEAGLDLAGKGRAYVRQLFADGPTQSFASSTAQFTQVSSATRSTAIGIDRALGNSTTADSEYVVEHGGNGSDVYAATGVREKIALGKRLTGDAALQHASAFGANAAGFSLYGLSLAYAVPNRFHANAQYQLRTGSGGGATLDVGAIGALSRGISAIVTANSTRTAGGFDTIDDRFSFAFRPADDDRSVTLLGYERKDGNVTALGGRTDVLSLEELYRPDRHLELAGRFAYKLDGNAYYAARTSLVGVRAVQRLSDRLDLGAEVRFLGTHGVAGASTSGLAIESGLRLGDAMRVAAGYNFSGSPDPALAAAPTRRGLYATITSTIDSIFGWGREPRR